MKKNILNAVEFDVSGNCNLNCSYCYFKSERVDVVGVSKYMKKEIVDAFFVNFIDCLNFDKRMKVSFWGGEPLLNFETVIYIVEKFKQVSFGVTSNISYLIVSNGTLVNDAVAKYCKKNNIQLQITVDSDEECHNKQRPYRDGSGTYNDIIKNIKILNDHDVDYYVRTTVTSNTELPSRIIERFKKYGIKNALFFPVFATCDCDYVELLDYNVLEVANDLFESYLREIECNGKFKIENYNRFERQIKSIYPHKSCGVYDEKIALKYDGTIFPCHRFFEASKYCLGDVHKGFDHKYSNRYYAALFNNKNCSKCELSGGFCGGSCLYEIMIRNDEDFVWNDLCEFYKALAKNIVKKEYEKSIALSKGV